MLKHASNASSAAGTAASAGAGAGAIAVPVNGQLLRTANVAVGVGSSTSSSSNNNSSNSNCNSSGSNNNSNSSSNNTPSASAASTALLTTTTTNNNVNGNSNHPVAATAAATVGNGSATGASPTPASAAVASTARNIHLRPPQPQPLNISALNASTCSAATLLNGRAATTLLNIATPPMKPLTPLTPNGNSLHHHTYTNQHMLASSSSSSHQQQHTQQQQQQQHHLQLQQQSQQQQQPNHAQPQLPHAHPQAQTQALHNHQHHHHHQLLNSNGNHNAQNYSHCNNLQLGNQSMLQASHAKGGKHGPGPREVLTSLGLLCLVSLLLALLSLIFLLKISPNSREDALTRSISSEDFIIVYDVTLALCALSLSLNLCCLLVCAIQFLFAVKLLRSPMFDGRDNKYLEKSSASRTCAVSGFFISIPVFLTGIILYTFNHFHSTPAIITSVLIGVGIVFCGGAMVHNVFVWQKEKTISYRSPPLPLNMSLLSAATQLPPLQFLTNAGYQPTPTPHGHGHALSQATTMPLYAQQNHSMLHPTSVTPVSPNHSHGSFNPLLCAAGANNNAIGNVINSPFLVRPATATPPTPKPIVIAANGSCLVGRETSGSVSPPTLDMSNITNISLHELSTLV